MGGGEFAIIMTQMDQAADAATLSKRIRDSVIKPYQVEGHQIVTDISIGISIAPMHAVESDELLRNADMALYDAKADGRGTFRFFEPEMNTRMKARRELEMDLRRALAGEQFELYYRPLVVLETNAVNGFEALLRCNHPMRGLVRFHSDRRGNGIDRASRRMGAQSGLRRSCQLARAHQSRGQPFTGAAQLPQSRQHGHSGAARIRDATAQIAA
jgi:predicted signal transduction protein with EAL and GGDEF domain